MLPGRPTPAATTGSTTAPAARSWTPWGFSESLHGGSTIRKPLYAIAPVVAASAVRTARRVLAGGDFDIVHGSTEAHYALGERTGLRLKVEYATRGGDPQVNVAPGDVANFDETRVSLFIERNFF